MMEFLYSDDGNTLVVAEFMADGVGYTERVFDKVPLTLLNRSDADGNLIAMDESGVSVLREIVSHHRAYQLLPCTYWRERITPSPQPEASPDELTLLRGKLLLAETALAIATAENTALWSENAELLGTLQRYGVRIAESSKRMEELLNERREK